jgi:hypothetical protein
MGMSGLAKLAMRQDKKKVKVFLGGTTNNSTWRKKIIPLLRVDYFNPVVDNWTKADRTEELKQREQCDYVLYTITKEMKGVYSIAEAVDDSNKQPQRLLFCVLQDGFSPGQLKSLKATTDMIKSNGGNVFTNLNAVAEWLNNKANK